MPTGSRTNSTSASICGSAGRWRRSARTAIACSARSATSSTATSGATWSYAAGSWTSSTSSAPSSSLSSPARASSSTARGCGKPALHTGPVKRLRIDTDKYALTKEGKGKTINLLLKHDHYSSLRKREKPLEQQHGCSDMCLCRRVVTPSRASLDSRASLGARPSDLSLSFVDVGRRSSLGARPVDITLGPDKRPRSLKGAYGRKPVPDASNSAERSSGRKKHQRAPLKPPLHRAGQNAPAPAPPAKPKTAAPAPPSKPKSPAPAPPSKPKSPAPAPPAKSRPTAPAPTPTPSPPVKKVQAPAPVVQTVKPKAASPRTKPRAQIPTPPETPKSPGVVLFQPESLKPVVKPKAPLVVLFEPEKTPVSKPTSSPVSKKATVNTATPAKPTSATVLDVEVEEPEAVSVKPRNAGVHLPRRAVFNGGRRRRSSAAALALMQEVSASLNAPEPVVVAPPAPAPVPSPPAPPATRSVAIKKSSKKVRTCTEIMSGDLRPETNGDASSDAVTRLLGTNTTLGIIAGLTLASHHHPGGDEADTPDALTTPVVETAGRSRRKSVVGVLGAGTIAFAASSPAKKPLGSHPAVFSVQAPRETIQRLQNQNKLLKQELSIEARAARELLGQEKRSRVEQLRSTLAISWSERLKNWQR
ncbi:hypothetical protein ON010_g17157 [Phytophthora cinnamomi]|nr:hypothetical protein ON010_g17157 [Phytophthora cinnamomi]